MAFSITSCYCTPLPAAAATRKRLPGAARLLLLGSGATSGGRVAIAAVLPAVGGARAGSSALTRCTAGDQAEPTPEPLMLATLDTLHEELRYWLSTNPPRSKEDFKKIEITTGKCMDLHKKMIEIIVHLPGNILKGIATIEKIDTTFVKLHNQSKTENPWADADTIEAATKGLMRLAQIFLERCKQIKYQASPMSEPLTTAAFTTLANKLRYWLTNPPKCKEDFKKIDIIVGKCIDLSPRMVHDFSIVPAGIIKEITDIIVSLFVKLRIQVSGEDPMADANAIDAAIKGIKRMAKIFDEGGPGLIGQKRP